MWNPGAFASRLARDRRTRQPTLARLHDEGVIERGPGCADVSSRRLLIVVPHVVAEEVTGDAELHVAVDEPVVGHIKLRDQRLEAVLAGEHMQMRGPHVMATLRAQQLTGGTID